MFFIRRRRSKTFCYLFGIVDALLEVERAGFTTTEDLQFTDKKICLSFNSIHNRTVILTYCVSCDF
jgi:hypothetical protein